MTTLIIPGYRGSEKGHWQQQWLLEDETARLVEQDDWDNPVLCQWLHVLEATLAETPGAVLVAHSLGCVLVTHLASRPSAAHIAGAVLVAPADAERMAVQDFEISQLCTPATPQARLPVNRGRQPQRSLYVIQQGRSSGQCLGFRLCRYEKCRTHQY